MNAIIQQWNIARIIRLVLAIVILVQGIIVKDTMTMVLAVFLGGMAIANVGCCGTNRCAINNRSSTEIETIEYEELDHKK